MAWYRASRPGENPVEGSNLFRQRLEHTPHTLDKGHGLAFGRDFVLTCDILKTVLTVYPGNGVQAQRHT